MFYYYLRITIKFVLKNKTNTGTDPIINTGTDLIIITTNDYIVNAGTDPSQ